MEKELRVVSRVVSNQKASANSKTMGFLTLRWRNRAEGTSGLIFEVHSMGLILSLKRPLGNH